MIEMSKKFSSLKANLLQIREDVQTLIERRQRRDSPLVRNLQFLSLFNFPLTTIEHLEEVNEYLIDEENFNNAVSILINNYFFLGN